MASDGMVQPPSGWQPHDFWGDLSLVAGSQRPGLAAASVFLALLVVGRALLPAADRPRLRMAFTFFALYFVLLPVKAGVLAAGMESFYPTTQLLATVALAWA